MRASLYTDELAREICDRIAGGESLTGICNDPEMPGKRTVLEWARDKDDFRAMYAEARDRQADHFAEEIISIADTDTDPQRARNRIDARKWFASKCAPKRYGDRLEHSGVVQLERVVSDDDRARALGLFLERIEARKSDD
jgi:hypothetical protein